METGRWDERAQAEQEVLRFEAQHVPPIGQAALHLIENGAVGRAAQATLAERRAQSVAGQVLQGGAIARVHRGAGVQRVAVPSGPQRIGGGQQIGQLDVYGPLDGLNEELGRYVIAALGSLYPELTYKRMYSGLTDEPASAMWGELPARQEKLGGK